NTSYYNCYATWAQYILPYVEQGNLYRMWDFKLRTSDSSPNNDAVKATPVKVYSCPSDPNLGKVLQPASGPGSGQLFATGSYRNVTGTSDANANTWFDIPDFPTSAWWLGGDFASKFGRGALHSVAVPGSSDPAYRGATPESILKIIDGTSNTFLV